MPGDERGNPGGNRRPAGLHPAPAGAGGSLRRGGRRTGRIALALALAACGPGGARTGLAPAAAQQAPGDSLPPVGFGTLKVDDIALLFQTQDLRIRVLPLDERVLRLLAPDSYASLAGLKRIKAAEIDEVARRYGIIEPALFSISFYGLSQRAPFVPEELTLQSRGRFFRPVGFVPMSPGWGERWIAQRGSEIAIVLYEPGMSLFDDDLVVAYQGFTTGAWAAVAPALVRERAAVLSRAAAAGRR